MDSNSPVCYKCIGDHALSRRILDEGTIHTCAHCAENRETFTIAEIAELYDEKYREFYQQGDEVPVLHEDDDDSSWAMEGDSPDEIAAQWLEADEDIAYAVVEYLSDQESGDCIRDGAMPMYELGFNYVFEDTGRHYHHDLWQNFCDRVRYVRRFYDLEGSKILEDLFAGLASLARSDVQPIITIKPDSNITIFRARRADDRKSVKSILRNAKKNLGPNPLPKRGGRLNAPGISTFYGALDRETCIAEKRPLVGGYIVVGSFQPIREMTILNLFAFPKSPKFPSFFLKSFDHEYELYLRLKFLSSFHEVVANPVLPSGENVEYVPTQAVAEFFRDHLKVDGILYRSAQMPENHKNIALFDSADIVEDNESKDEQNEELSPFKRIALKSMGLDIKPKRRPPRLRYIDNSARFYRVKAVNYQTDTEYELD